MATGGPSSSGTRRAVKRIWVLALLILVVCGALVVIAGYSPLSLLKAGRDATEDEIFSRLTRSSVSPADLEKLTRVNFPKGTSLRNAVLFRWLDSNLFARLEMDEAACQQFTSLPRFAGKFSSTDRHEMVYDLTRPHGRLSWWRPDDIQNFRAAEDTIWPTNEDYEKILVIISFDQPNTHDVYLWWSSTK